MIKTRCPKTPHCSVGSCDRNLVSLLFIQQPIDIVERFVAAAHSTLFAFLCFSDKQWSGAEVAVLKHPVWVFPFCFFTGCPLHSCSWLYKRKPPPTCVHSASRMCGPSQPNAHVLSMFPAAVGDGGPASTVCSPGFCQITSKTSFRPSWGKNEC